MKLNFHVLSEHILSMSIGVAALLIFGSQKACAQPTIVSTIPANLASGVSASAAVVITFSEPMDTTQTSVQFFTISFTMLTTTVAWSAGNTILTCTPTPAFPAGTNIIWSVTGQDLAGMSLSGSTGGFFTTASGSGGGSGSGTNAITSFVAGKTYLNLQTTPGPPSPNTNPTYSFIASTTLSSNRTANTITLGLPSGGTSNLVQDILQHEYYFLFATDTNNARFESTFPEGSYVFSVTAPSSNQLVTVTLPTSMAQPNAPHISNYTAAQSLNAAEAFTLTWDPFEGGTATDYIFLTVGNKAFQTPSPGTTGALNGTATSATIPAGTLSANSNYAADLIFYHTTGASNSTYATGAYRASVTHFNIGTSGSVSPGPLISSPLWGPGGFSFDVASTPGQVLKVLYSADLSLPIAQWLTVVRTNSTGMSVHVTVPPQPGTNGYFRIGS